MLLDEIVKLVDKGAVHRISASEAHVTSPVFAIPKSGGGLRLIIDLRFLNAFMTPPHFKMEGLYMLPSIISHKWTMVKLDLKDAYSPYCKGVLESPSLSSKLGHPHAVPLPAF